MQIKRFSSVNSADHKQLLQAQLRSDSGGLPGRADRQRAGRQSGLALRGEHREHVWGENSALITSEICLIK